MSTVPFHPTSDPEPVITPVLPVEVRTLKERLIVVQARNAVLEDRLVESLRELETCRIAVTHASVLLNIIAIRGRQLLEVYEARGLLGRVKLLARVREYLDLVVWIERAIGRDLQPDIRKPLDEIGQLSPLDLFLSPAEYRRTIRALVTMIRRRFLIR